MELNIPQKYFILSCNEKGSIRIFKNTRRRAYLAESSFFRFSFERYHRSN
jgi:hypothetical protein